MSVSSELAARRTELAEVEKQLSAVRRGNHTVDGQSVERDYEGLTKDRAYLKRQIALLERAQNGAANPSASRVRFHR